MERAAPPPGESRLISLTRHLRLRTSPCISTRLTRHPLLLACSRPGAERRLYKRYALSNEKTFSSLFFPEKPQVRFSRPAIPMQRHACRACVLLWGYSPQPHFTGTPGAGLCGAALARATRHGSKHSRRPSSNHSCSTCPHCPPSPHTTAALPAGPLHQEDRQVLGARLPAQARAAAVRPARHRQDVTHQGHRAPHGPAHRVGAAFQNPNQSGADRRHVRPGGGKGRHARGGGGRNGMRGDCGVDGRSEGRLSTRGESSAAAFGAEALLPHSSQLAHSSKRGWPSRSVFVPRPSFVLAMRPGFLSSANGRVLFSALLNQAFSVVNTSKVEDSGDAENINITLDFSKVQAERPAPAPSRPPHPCSHSPPFPLARATPTPVASPGHSPAAPPPPPKASRPPIPPK